METRVNKGKKKSKKTWIDSLSIEDIPSEPMQTIASCCGMHIVTSLMENLPGIQIYIPRKCKKMLNLKYIRETFTGNNMSAVAVHIGKDREYVQKILRANKKKARVTDKDVFCNNGIRLVRSNCSRDIAIRLILNSDQLLNGHLYVPLNGFRITKEKFIQRSFSGSNTKQLALECGVSDRYISKVISMMYHTKRDKRGVKNNGAQ